MNKIPEQIKHYARLISHSPIEILFYFDDEFKLRFAYIGDADRVPSLHENEQVTKDLPHWEGLSSLHNHSVFSTTCSIPDIWCAVYTKLKAQFIVRKDGIIHGIARKQEHWHPDLRKEACVDNPFSLWMQELNSLHPFYPLFLLRPRHVPAHRKRYNDTFEQVIQGFDVHYLTETL